MKSFRIRITDSRTAKTDFKYDGVRIYVPYIFETGKMFILDAGLRLSLFSEDSAMEYLL